MNARRLLFIGVNVACLVFAPAGLALSKQSNLMAEGYALMVRGSHAQAVEILMKAVALDPNDIQARRYLAHALLRSGKPLLAAKQLELVMQSGPVQSGDMLALSDAYLAAGEPDKARSVCKAAARQTQTSAGRAQVEAAFVRIDRAKLRPNNSVSAKPEMRS